MDRMEFTCNQCGRTRLLSKEEAEDDGWFIHSQYGLSCPHCIEYYGLPIQPQLSQEEEIEQFRNRYYASKIIII